MLTQKKQWVDQHTCPQSQEFFPHADVCVNIFRKMTNGIIKLPKFISQGP